MVAFSSPSSVQILASIWPSLQGSITSPESLMPGHY